jgi:hypothetical protein
MALDRAKLAQRGEDISAFADRCVIAARRVA